MAFMVPEIEHMSAWHVETTCGTECVPVDVVGNAATLQDFVEGKLLEVDPELVSGWFARLSAPGYMDCTGWSGPFATEDEAREHIRDFYEVDPDTGDDLDNGAE